MIDREKEILIIKNVNVFYQLKKSALLAVYGRIRIVRRQEIEIVLYLSQIFYT